MVCLVHELADVRMCLPIVSDGTVMFYDAPEPEDLVRVSPYDVFRREIITYRFTLDDYADALAARRGDQAVHKIIIKCWQP
jgi:hypothetical protein